MPISKNSCGSCNDLRLGELKIIFQGTGDIKASCSQCKKNIAVAYSKEGTDGTDGKRENARLLTPDTLSEGPDMSDYDRCKRDNDIESVRKIVNKKTKKARVKELWDEFLGQSTLHGFHFCFEDNTKIRKLAWAILVISAFSLFLDKFVDSINNYFEYPFSTNTVLEFTHNISFPSVSVCNYNEVRMTKMNGTIIHRMNEIEKKYGRNEEFVRLEKLLTGEVEEAILVGASHKIEDMVLNCTFADEPCDHSHFHAFRDAQGDTCFTFHPGKKGKPTLFVTETGIDTGLMLIMNTEHHEYYFGTKEAGFRVILHDQDETPVKMQGFSVSPGFTTFTEVRKTKFTYLRSPYKTKCDNPPMKYMEGQYTRSKCYLDTLTQYVVGKCGCRDWFMPGDDPICDFNLTDICLKPKRKYFDKKKLYHEICPLACEATEYTPVLSYTMFPANVEADRWAKEHKAPGGNDFEKRMWIRENYLQMYVFYENMHFYNIVQQPSYDVYNLLGDVGGQMGLFIGASSLSLFEFIDVAVAILWTLWKYRDEQPCSVVV